MGLFIAVFLNLHFKQGPSFFGTGIEIFFIICSNDSVCVCAHSQTFQDLRVHLVVFWHQPQLDRDAGFYHLMPQSMRWHCYSMFLRTK